MNAEGSRQRLLEAEATVLQALATARAVISQQEEELAELRRQVAATQVEIFTEREFAAKLKVSADSLANQRKAGRIQPLMVGDCIRYSSVDHLQKVGEIFAARTEAKRTNSKLHSFSQRRVS